MSRYRLTLDSYAMGRVKYGPIPGTTMILDIDLNNPDKKAGEIWHGYLWMREEQKKHPVSSRSPCKVKLTEDTPEIDKVREAFDLFFRFLAGEGRDNWLQVTHIEALDVELVL